MDQQHILDLLREAAEPGCTAEKRDEIRQLFLEALGANNSDNSLVVQQRMGILRLLHPLYSNIAEHDPSRLVDLAPAFMAACGSREAEALTASIDWTLFEDHATLCLRKDQSRRRNRPRRSRSAGRFDIPAVA